MCTATVTIVGNTAFLALLGLQSMFNAPGLNDTLVIAF
jgi:hypothetical protein